MDTPVAKFWPSWRLTFTICAFFIMFAQQWLNNSLNFAVLCMIKPQDNTTEETQFRQSNNSECAYNVEGVAGLAMEGELNWSKQDVWVLLSSYYYGYIVVLPFAGRLADRFGGKYFLLTGLIGQGIMYLVFPIAARTAYGWAKTVRLIQGLVAGFDIPSLYQLFTVWGHPNERAALMSFVYGGHTIGSLTAFPFTSLLCHIGWNYVFYALGAGTLFLGVICYFCIYNTLNSHPWLSKEEYDYLKTNREDKKTNIVIPWTKIVTSTPIIAFTITHICNSFVVIILSITLPKFLSEVMYFNLKENGFYSSANHLGGLTSKIIVMFVLARICQKSKLSLTVIRKIVLAFGNSVAIVSLIVLTFLNCVDRMFIILLIYIIGLGGDLAFIGAYWVSVIDLAPAFAGLLSGVSNSLAQLTGIVAPSILAHSMEEGTKEEWNYLFYAMVLAYTISLCIYSTFGSSKTLPWGDGSVSTPEVENGKISK